MPVEGKANIVPPFSKEDIVKIIQEALLNGTIASEKATIADNKTYVLKIVNGAISLVEEVE